MTTAAVGLAARKLGKVPVATEHVHSSEDDVWDESRVDQEEGSTSADSADERLHGSGSPSTSRASSNFSSSILAKSPEDALAAMFDQRVQLLSSTLEGLKGKCELLQEQLAESSAVCSSYASRLARSEEGARRLRVEAELGKERERQLQQEAARLEALLEASRLQASYSEARHQAAMAEERSRAERLRAMRDDALLQRDNALSELSGCYADVDALQATLADSALYVRYLRKRLLELELQLARQQQQQHAASSDGGSGSGSGSSGGGASGAGGGGGGGVFSLASIRTAIQAAVAEAAACGEEERRKRVRQLQLRWHPDKNPVLTEFATEVSKIINEAVADMEQRAAAGGSSGGGSSGAAGGGGGGGA
ncbi:hypothetical protein HYH02_013339 [Chlamydomonas schloesseri]|uniref:J domain-containing protein n=1 Tax=Chlamydomonas schloesseri TaxID=2026947 RepID=A0A835SQI6_9CHLO|nr:hypothetical protein HYH02_013339 [Chlamydomonas schloesseri]|eukprot:KAG2431349.1 hypothetical protein HYH02_013339 [Chlamydomonas schloesseri]